MKALQIALALAVSMLIFSTLASMVLEIFYKVTRIRQRGLKKMLDAFFESEVKQKIQVMLARDGAAGEDKSVFIDKLTSMTGGSHTLSTIEFIRQLANTEIGKRLAQRAESEVDALIDYMTERYEEYGRWTSQIFRRYSQIGTVIVSVMVAMCLNINVVTIFRTLQNNEQLVRAIAGQAEQAIAAYQVAELRRAAAQKDESEVTTIDSEIEDLKAIVGEVKKSFYEVKQLGLPIGWSGNKFFNPDDIKKTGWLLWILSTVFTGLLIGLGGPFWFDMLKRISLVSQVTGALVRESPDKDETGDQAERRKGLPTVLPADPKTAFKLIIRAQGIMDGKGDDTGGLMGPRALRL
jgi:hypothetical protein